MTRDLADYQQRYAELPFEAIQIQFRKRKTLETLAKYRPRRLLEIGCGLDPIFLHIDDFEQLTVVEPADAFYANALAASRTRSNVRVVHGSLESQGATLSSMAFDLILLSSLLHEVSDAAGLLRSVSRLCRPATLVHIVVPNARSLHRLLALEMGLIADVHDRSPTQVAMQQSTTFDVDSLTTFVERCGFAVLECGTFFLKPFTHAQMAQCYEAGIVNDQMLEGLYKVGDRFPQHGSEIFMNVRLRE